MDKSCRSLHTQDNKIINLVLIINNCAKISGELDETPVKIFLRDIQLFCDDFVIRFIIHDE